DQVYIRRRMLQFLATIPPGTRIAVFTLGTTLKMITGFTTDAAEVAKALGPGKGNAERSALMDPDFTQAANEQLDTANSLGISPAAVSSMRQFVSDNQNFAVGLREEVTLDALDELARYLSTIPGRKNLVWFTAGFPLRFLEGGSDPNMDPMADYTGQVKKAAELLALSRVAVYPVDTRGLLNTPSSDAGTTAGIAKEMQTVPAGSIVNGQNPQAQIGGGNSGIGSFSQDQSQNPNPEPGVGGEVGSKDQTFMNDVVSDHFNMDRIAKETGGEAFYNRNSLGSALGEAIANGSSYYTIGYTPEDHNYNGALRQIAVQVEGGRYDLEYRHAYFADPPGDAVKWTPGKRNALIDAMQHGSPALSQVVFSVRALPANDPALKNVAATTGPAGSMAAQLKNARRFVVDYWIDPRGLDHTSAPDGSQQSQVELTEVAYDVNGIRVNYADQALGITQTQEQAARALQGGLALRQQIDLPAENVYLRVGVHDMLSGRIGTLEIALPAGK
ncbi:MAG TPA: VWA domain-containing protein, partial [Acidobacteriaceae bacterium]|nr:VWA domain-containing protein [Acidobacteriaceae bacterium]